MTLGYSEIEIFSLEQSLDRRSFFTVLFDFEYLNQCSEFNKIVKKKIAREILTGKFNLRDYGVSTQENNSLNVFTYVQIFRIEITYVQIFRIEIFRNFRE